MRNKQKKNIIYHLFTTLNISRQSGTSFVAKYKNKNYAEELVIKPKYKKSK